MQYTPTSWYIVATLTLGLLATSYGWNSTYNKLTKERYQYVQTVQTFKDAQAEANRKAKAKRVEIEKEAKASAKKADDRYSDLLAKYRTNLVRYKANQGGSTGPNSNQHQAPTGSPGSGGSPDVLTITLRDAEVCAINTARLQAVRDWAISLPN